MSRRSHSESRVATGLSRLSLAVDPGLQMLELGASTTVLNGESYTAGLARKSYNHLTLVKCRHVSGIGSKRFGVAADNKGTTQVSSERCTLVGLQDDLVDPILSEQ